MPDTQPKINVAAAVPLQGGKMPMATPVPASAKDEVDEEVTVDRESYNELRAENIKLANRNRKLQNTIDGLSATAGSASGQHATEITALKHGRAQADKRAKELEEKCTELRENNARLKADVDKLASQTAELSIKGRQDHIAAQNEKQKLEAENEKNTSETKALREKLEATVGRRNAEQEEHTKLIAKLKAENKFLGPRPRPEKSRDYQPPKLALDSKEAAEALKQGVARVQALTYQNSTPGHIAGPQSVAGAKLKGKDVVGGKQKNQNGLDISNAGSSSTSSSSYWFNTPADFTSYFVFINLFNV